MEAVWETEGDMGAKFERKHVSIAYLAFSNKR